MKEAAKSVTAYLTGRVPSTDLITTIDPKVEVRHRILEHLALHGPTVPATLAEDLGISLPQLDGVLEAMREQGVVISKSLRDEGAVALASHEA